MKILVCGTREDLTQKQGDIIMDRLMTLHGRDRHVIVHGAAPGVDSFADKCAKRLDWLVKPYPAKWKEHGKSAGPIRNQRMLDNNPDIELVLAFPIKTSRGTWDMVERAVKARIPVRVYPL